MSTFEEKLIMEVKKYPVLYAKSSGGYKNIKTKFRIWDEIATCLSSTAEDCQRRWKSLRDRFTREANSKDLPSGSAAVKVGEWEHYVCLLLLKEHIKPRKGRGNFSEVVTDETIDLSLDETFTGSSEVDPALDSSTSIDALDSEHSFLGKRRKVKQEDLNSELFQTMGVFKDYLVRVNSKSTVPQSPQEPNDVFGKSVSAIISTLNAENQKRAKAEILKYLADVQLQEINN